MHEFGSRVLTSPEDMMNWLRAGGQRVLDSLGARTLRGEMREPHPDGGFKPFKWEAHPAENGGFGLTQPIRLDSEFQKLSEQIHPDEFISGQIMGVALPKQEFMIRRGDNAYSSLAWHGPNPYGGAANVSVLEVREGGEFDLYNHGGNFDGFHISTVGLSGNPFSEDYGANPEPYGRAAANYSMGLLDLDTLNEAFQEMRVDSLLARGRPIMPSEAAVTLQMVHHDDRIWDGNFMDSAGAGGLVVKGNLVNPLVNPDMQMVAHPSEHIDMDEVTDILYPREFPAWIEWMQRNGFEPGYRPPPQDYEPTL